MRAIILIHGFLTNIEDFKTIIPDLEKMYDHVERYVVPGHTVPPKYRHFNVNDTFDTLLSTYDKLDQEYDIIDCIGFSMGGALACWLQSVREINQLVLLAPANKYFNFDLFNNRNKYKSEKKSNISYNKKNDLDYSTYESDLQKLANDDRASAEIAIKMLIPHYSIHNLSTFTSIVKRCNKELIAITCPVLLIWGKLDQFVPEASINYLYNLSLNKRKKMIYDNLSHLMLASEMGEVIKKEILNFLKENNNVNK